MLCGLLIVLISFYICLVWCLVVHCVYLYCCAAITFVGLVLWYYWLLTLIGMVFVYWLHAWFCGNGWFTVVLGTSWVGLYEFALCFGLV